MEVGRQDFTFGDILFAKKTTVTLSKVLLENILCAFPHPSSTAHLVQELLNLKHVAASESTKTQLDECAVVEGLSVIVLMENDLRESGNYQQFLAFFAVVDGVVVDEVKQSLYPCLLVLGMPENQVAIGLELLLVHKLEEIMLFWHFLMDAVDQGSAQKVCVFKHFEGQLCSITLHVIETLNLLADLIHQINQTNQILKPLTVFRLIGVEIGKCFLELALNQHKVGLEGKINSLFSDIGSCCFSARRSVFEKTDV